MNLRYILCCLALLLATSCTKDEPVNINQPGSSLFETLTEQKDLSLYQAALKRSGMLNADTFSVGGPFTVFAPVDSAFINVGLTLDSINKFDPAALRLILEYVMVYGRISSSTLAGFYAQDVTCKHPVLQPRLNKNYYGIFFNGLPLVPGGSITLADGVLHKLIRFPFPQDGDLLEKVQQQPDLSFFAALVERTGNTSMLTNTTELRGRTVFAPTDDAFRKLGFADIDVIKNGDISILTPQIQNMIFIPRLYTADLKGGYSFSFDSFYAKTDGFTLISAGNVDPTHIIRSDIMATNGVLHVVDQVLF
jgi:uncharacterized surface protein with fasciclin (FAS1) repeats